MDNKIIESDLKQITNRLLNYSDKLNGKSLLLTGAAGFIGKYIFNTIDYFNSNILDKPCTVIAVDNYITGLEKKYDYVNQKWIKHDIRNQFQIDDDVDYIIHAAGLGSPAFYDKFRIETIEVGTIGTKNILELANDKNVDSMIFFSSSEVYGNPDPKFIPTPETYNGNVSPIGPRSCYDESKRLGETYCVTYNEIYQTPVKIIRPFNVFGPGLRFDDKRVIPNFISFAMKGEDIPIYGDGMQTRTFCYISDFIVGMFQVLFSDYNGEVFNIGNPDGEIGMEALASLACELFGNNSKPTKVEDVNTVYNKNTDPYRRCPDIHKISNLVGFNPEIELKEGLKRTIEWFQFEYKDST